MFDRTRLQRAAAAALGTLTVLGALTSAFAPSAGAAVGAGKLITVLPLLDGIEVGPGYKPGETVQVALIRNGVTIGNATEVMSNAGDGGVNTSAADCWSGVTPDLLPGDVVQITDSAGNIDTMPIADITITQPAAETTAGTVTVAGTIFSFDAAGTRIPVTSAAAMEVRILGGRAPNQINRNRLIAPGDGTVTADGAGGFTATFTGLSPSDVQQTVAGTSQARAVIVNAAGGTESTSADFGGGPGGPIDPACPPGTVSDRVSSVTPTAINVANSAANLVASGVAANPGGVKVRVTNGALAAGPFTASATGASTWTVSIAANALANLGDGTWTVTGLDAANNPFPTAALTVSRDTAAPAGPTANIAAGNYTSPQSVSLFDVDNAAVIRFTTNGVDPTAASPTFASPISVGFGSTTIKAIAIDPAGNVSPISSFAYTITQPTTPPAGGGTGGGTTPAAATNGYRLVGADGGMFTFGGAGFFGSLGGVRLNAPIITSVATPSGNGYWMVGADGGIFTFGDARFFGSTGSLRLNQPIVGMMPTKSGNGYWLVARDGGIFTFGDAPFLGSTGSLRLNQPIIGMARTGSGNGYWLVARDGGIFSFGDAGFLGSTGGLRLNQPIIGMTVSKSGNGYWLFARDGGLFTFGDAAFLGSTGGLRLNSPIVSMLRSASGNGYWLVGADGGIFTFGDAAFLGSRGGAPLNSPIVAMI